jgi:amidase
MKGFSYKDYDALGIAELIRAKEITPSEVVNEAINRIELLNPELNAVIYKMYEKAEAAAKKLHITDGPLAGVPVLLKNMTQEIEGEPITSGSKALKSYKAERDTNFVKRLREAGLLFLGQTNVPEFSLMGITEPQLHGATKNPWHTEYTPGGSSGGAAAAVASGMVPVAGANDGGGSIRIPAAYCGLFGLKPTRGRTPVGPKAGRHWQGASVDHVITRTVRDSAAILDMLNIHEKEAAFQAPVFNGSYLDCLNKPLDGRLKIAFSIESPIGTEVHSDCAKAVKQTAVLLEGMGHHIEEKNAPADGKAIANAYLTMYFGEVAASITNLEGVLGRKAKSSDVEPSTWLLGLLGRATSAEEFVLSLREWDQAAFAMEGFQEEYDLYMTPATAYPPAKIGELELKSLEKLLIKAVGSFGMGSLLKKSGIVDQIAEQSLKRTPFTQLANLTGQPAMSVPLGNTAEGLPAGVQFSAARGREDLLLQIAAELEKTESWTDVKENDFFRRG